MDSANKYRPSAAAQRQALGRHSAYFISREGAVPEPSSRSELIQAMLVARTKLDSLIERIPRSTMALPGASHEWSVKDIVAHINSYDRWLALGLALRGQKPPDSWIEDIPLVQFNHRLFLENRKLPLDEVLHQSQDLWNHILQETQATPEAYLFSEHSVEGVPYKFRPCDILKSESYGHYLDHVPALTSWLNKHQ